MYRTTTCSYNGIDIPTGVAFARIEHVDNYDTFATDRQTTRERVQRNNHKPQNYLYKIDRSPRKFFAEFGCETEEKKEELIQWLYLDKYAPFISGDDSKIYYCMPVGESKYWTNGEGCYVSLEMECSDEYSYSTLVESTYDFSSSTSAQSITINNTGHVPVYPILQIEVVQSGSTIKIMNTSNGNKYLQFSTDSENNQLITGEKITVNNYKGQIDSDQLALYRYSNQTGDFIELVKGNNVLTVEGKCKLKFSYQFRYLY